jgi:3-methyladenine DNA glycosylase AlkD
VDAHRRLNAADLAAEIEASLAPLGTSERAAAERAYLKSELRHLGVPVPAVRRVAKAFVREHPELDSVASMALVRALWDRGIHECRMAAVELLVLCEPALDATDLEPIERLIRTAGTWALVDPLAVDVAGGIASRDRDAGDRLDRWAADPDFWVRRAALLALLRPIRAGGGDADRFFRYADRMLDEREFFVRKAVGWVLREMGKRRPGLVVEWLEPRIGRAPGVTVREAVKPLDPADRERLLAAHRRRRTD